ncbi:MAG: ABC transporter ATP-binding protein [Acidimicrobiales bacterium]|jgi:ATP-binding cassette subfamily B protein
MSEATSVEALAPSGSPIGDGLRLVRGYARSNWRPFTIASVGSVIYAAGTVGSAFGLGWAVDEALVPHFQGADSRHWAAVAILVGIMVIRTVGVVARRYYAGMTTARCRMGLQREMAVRLVEMPLALLRSRAPGTMLANIDADSESAVDVMHPAPFTIGVLSMLIFAIAGLAAIDLPLMFATVGVLPIVVGASWVTAILLEKPTTAEREANAAVTAATTEIIAGTQVIKTLGREDAELERFAGIVETHRASRVHVGALKMGIDTSFSMIPQLAMILIVVVGASRVASGILEPGDLVQAVALFGVLAFPIQVIGFFLTDLPLSVVGRRRIDALLSEPDDPLRAQPANPQPLPVGPIAAQLSDIRVGETDHPRIEGLTLAIAAGETLALVGPTGGGKSTALDVLARLRPIDAGTITYDEIPAENVADPDLRGRVTVAAQNAVLFTGTVRSNVDYGRGLSDAEIEGALGLAGGADLASILPDGFDTVVGERGVAVSGGQRQRIALARALAGDPGLVLLDDATSAVDPVREEEILAGLAELPTTIVMVTHRVAAMVGADRVALIAGGRVVETGDHETLLANPEYRDLVAAYEREAAL